MPLLEGQPLPTQVPLRYQERPNSIRAYDLCLGLEKSLQQKINNGENIKQNTQNLIYCRILGYLIHYPPQDQALVIIVDGIVSCQNDQDVLDLGKMYFDHFIRAFRHNKGVTHNTSGRSSSSSSSSLSNHSSFDTTAEMIQTTLQEPSLTNSSKRTAQKLALIRDNFRCLITGEFDVYSVDKSREMQGECMERDVGLTITACTNIIPEDAQIPTNPNKNGYATSVWDVLRMFGYTNLAEELKDSKIHRLENVMTLATFPTNLFDRLFLWLVPTDQPNTYQLKTSNDPLYLRQLPKYVTFDTKTDYPLPKREYLKLHAMCAQVANFSGAAKYIADIFDAVEDAPYLAPDGSSAHLLEQALLCHSPRTTSS